MKKLHHSILFILGLVFCSFSFQKSEGWTNLLDLELNNWEIYQSYSYDNSYDGKQPVDINGKPIAPIGYNKNVGNTFSMILIQGEPVLKITGEYYGCMYTKKEYENYHLSMKVKWGEKKWLPRQDKLKDSGILYHSTGLCGVDYWRSWMLSQEFQIMEGHMGDYWSIANSAIDVRAFLPEGKMNAVAGDNQPFISIGSETGLDGFCLRSANYESPDDEWTSIDLICLGDKSLHIVNGQVVMVLQNSRYVVNGESIPMSKGRIQIQSEAAEVFYKEIKIYPIKQIPTEFADYFN